MFAAEKKLLSSSDVLALSVLCDHINLMFFTCDNNLKVITCHFAFFVCLKRILSIPDITIACDWLKTHSFVIDKSM